MTPATALYEQAKIEAYGRAAEHEFTDYVEQLKSGSITFHFSDGVMQKVHTQEYRKPKLTNLDITD